MRNLFFSVWLLISGTVSAQNEAHSLLWKISGNGLAQPSYVYGTIHMIDKKDFSVRSAIDSVFDLSQVTAFELTMDDYSIYTKMQSWVNLPEGQSLQDFCTPEEYALLGKYVADSLHGDIALFSKMKPFALYQLMASGAIKGEMQSFEGYFLSKSMASQKPIEGLEPVEAELKIFDSISYKEQMGWLLQAVNEAGKEAATWDDLVKAYQTENLPELARLVNETAPEITAHIDLFIYDRNKNWIPEIENLIKDQSVFIAVGAGHLPGENGLLQLLRKAGYTIEPLF